MKKSILILLTLLGVSQAAAATEDSGWIGLWRLEMEGQNKDLAFLVVSGTSAQPSIQYYDRTWGKQVILPQPAENGGLVFESLPRAKTFRFEFKAPVAGKAEGQWIFVHPQYHMSGATHATRLLSVDHWDPFSGIQALEKPNHIVDLNAFLLEKAPLNSLPAFVSFWRTKVEPDFYLLLEDKLYRDDPGINRTTLLKPVFELLKKREFRETAARSATEMERVIAEIKAKAPDFYKQNPVVLMPSFGKFDASTDYVGRRLTIRFGVDLVAQRYPGAQFTSFLARQQLRLPFYQLFSLLDDRLGIELIKEGIASYMVVSTGLAPNADVCLGLPDGTYAANREKLAEYRKLLLAKLELGDPAEVKRMLDGEDGSKKGLMVAYRFGEQFCSRFKPAELPEMGPRRVIELLRSSLSEGGPAQVSQR
jgi:hypothetical protein